MAWRPIRFLFENDAADETLPRDHWFWDESRSGGIFIEHGVHFFDAAAMFIDTPASSVVAASTHRPGWPAPDLVSATVTHGDCLATHTHSFNHAHRCERQLMRIDFGAAEARIHGWIPVHAVLDVHTDSDGEDRLRRLLADESLMTAPGLPRPQDAIEVESAAVPGPETALGRSVELPASRRVRVRLTLGGRPAKQNVYAASVASALRDLHDCRTTPGRLPKSNARTASEAVRVAEAATRSAALGCAVPLAGDRRDDPDPHQLPREGTHP
jgi:predicted dehydrogenase